MRRLVTIVSFISLLSFCSVVAAGPAEEKRAGELFDKAESEYQAGRFADAVELLLEAQRLSPDAVLHYNLARAYEGMGDLDRALASYRAYVEADPKSKDRGAVEARIKTIEELRESRERAAEPAPAPTPTAPKPVVEASSPSPAPWIVAGIGALGFGVAGALGGVSLARSDEAEDPATSGRDAIELHDEASTFATGANIAFGVAGAVVAAGVIWGIVDVVSSNGSEAEATVSFSVGPTQIGVSGTF